MMRKDLPCKWRIGLAAVALCLLSACATGRESLRASFDHSEWHPHSMLVLDVATGGFQAEFRDGTRAVGRFSTDEMREIRARLAAARAAGFAPREGVEPVLVVSNGGTPILELEDGEMHLRTPARYHEWSPEAYELQDYISRRLYERGDDWTMPRHRFHLGRIG